MKNIRWSEIAYGQGVINHDYCTQMHTLKHGYIYMCVCTCIYMYITWICPNRLDRYTHTYNIVYLILFYQVLSFLLLYLYRFFIVILLLFCFILILSYLILYYVDFIVSWSLISPYLVLPVSTLFLCLSLSYRSLLFYLILSYIYL